MKAKFQFQSNQNLIEILAVIVLGFFLAFYLLVLFWPQGNPYDSVKVTIPKGASLKQVSLNLKKQNVIRDNNSFLLAVKVLGYEKDIPAGQFRLKKASTNFQIIDQLVNGVQISKRVTIREGWTVSMVARELERILKIDSDYFEEASNNKTFLKKLDISGKSFEGYLFPNTYQFTENELPFDIINRMVSEFKKNFSDEMYEQMKKVGMTEIEVLTLASIIEGEAIYDRERPTISGVYHNRLKRGMRLQADPTIQYIIDDSPRRLLNKDLKIDSPYNTYLYNGLPPGPINNPGLESIKAALYPEKNDYLYFVARGDGYHTFSKTKRQHDKAKRDFQKVRRSLRKQKLRQG